jgi:hypothetical protein
MGEEKEEVGNKAFSRSMLSRRWDSWTKPKDEQISRRVLTSV